jgi:hypothetical protein
MSEEAKIKRKELIGILKKWIRAFEDNRLAEEAAVGLYTSQIQEFTKDLEIAAHRDISKQLDFSIEEHSLRHLQEKLIKELEINTSKAGSIVIAVRNILLGPKEGRENPNKDQSIRHITLEEIEHIEEFSKMKSLLKNIIQYLESLD